jgi:hypothetical protein
MVKQPGCQRRTRVATRAYGTNLSFDQDRLSVGEVDRIAMRFHLCTTLWADRME